MKKLILILLALCLLLTACGGQSGEEQNELWVLTEQTGNNDILQQIEFVIDQFQEQHPEISVKLDILPGNEESRAGYLQKLRAEVMSGGGPDVYLMPTAAQEPPTGEESATPYLQPLFTSVPQQMYNGIFADISEFYDADEELRTDGLVTAVMDAGVMDGARYVLPLRYDYDVLLVDMDAMAELSVDMSEFDGSIDGIYGLALTLNDEIAAHALNVVPSYCSLSDYLDQEKGNVLFDAGELAELLDYSRQVTILENPKAHQDDAVWNGWEWYVRRYAYEGYVCNINAYIKGGSTQYRIFSAAGYPFYRMALSDCVEAAAAIKQSGHNIAMYPVRAVDGSLVAEITYYGAVGSGCENAELAYEFLRLFLTEEIQWEQYWPRNSGSQNTVGLVDDSYPVRTAGSAEPFYENIRTRLQALQDKETKEKDYTYLSRRKKFLVETFTIDDSDIPVLASEVDEARFPVITAEGEIFTQYLARFESGEEALTLAEEMTEELKWLLSEG